MKRTRFHWALPVEALKNSEGQRDVSGQVDITRLRKFVELADQSVIESLLTPFGFHMPDPVPLLGMLSTCTERIGFLLAYRTGSISPVLFAQQFNTLSQLLPDRLSVNFVAGISPEEQAKYGDFLSHDERYKRAGEFIEICRSHWNEGAQFDFTGKHFELKSSELKTGYFGKGKRPRIYISGNSVFAQSQALELGDCWLRYGDSPEIIKASINQAMMSRGMAVGLRISVIARASRQEALIAAQDVIRDADPGWKEFIRGFVERSDSKAVRHTYSLSETAKEQWINEDLWTGAIPFRGGPALAIVGDYSQVSRALKKFERVGVSEFILSGWPSQEELIRFDQEVFPRFKEGDGCVRTA